MFFLSDLMRRLDVDCEVDFMAVASYGSSTDSSGVVRILKDLDAPIEGRDVLIVEDIVDSGLTLSYLLRTLKARDPASLEVCALLEKPERRKVDLPIRYTGFEIPNKFVIGYGLDHAERYRNLPYVAVLEGGLRNGVGGAALPPCYASVSAAPRLFLSHEQILQERGVPDPDRDRAGVFRQQGHQPGQRAEGSATTASS